jgi:thymidylate synthase (FAD)
MKETYKGMSYYKPEAYIIGENGIAHSEFAGRTCYDSYDKSENNVIKDLNNIVNINKTQKNNNEIKKSIQNIIESDFQEVEESELLKQLSFVHFHHSVLEHSVITFYIKGISRAVLQELARHRIASYSVKSTRYTLDMIMYIFIVSKYILNDITSKEYFIKNTLSLNLFNIADDSMNRIELDSIYKKLDLHTNNLGKDETLSLIIPKSNIERFNNSHNIEEALEILSEKKKRNVGDAFKSIVVSESMKVDLTMTINLRSLKNFFDLRLSGAAWFQIQWLAQEMKNVLPMKYKSLIFKEKKGE